MDFQNWITQYGYVGVFFILMLEMIGVPIPVPILTLSGIAWANGTFLLLPLILSASLGHILGSSISFNIGRWLGQAILIRYGKYVGITNRSLTKAEQQFHKNKHFILVFSKFIAGVRILIPYLAGINQISFTVFTIYNTIGAITWVIFHILLGRTISNIFESYQEVIRENIILIVIAAVLFIGVYVWIKKNNKKQVVEPSMVNQTSDNINK